MRLGRQKMNTALDSLLQQHSEGGEMKFKTRGNLIDLLVCQSLYLNPDPAMRELLQNAQDDPRPWLSRRALALA